MTRVAGGPDEALRAHCVSKSFGGITALSEVNLSLRRGQVTALIGPNGAGKTTMVNVLTGIYRPDSGSVKFAGRDVTNYSTTKRAKYGLVRTFQRVRLFPQLTVLENALAGRWSRRWSTVSTGRDRDEAMDLLTEFQLASAAQRSPASLTFGDSRRLEIVRCLLSDPSVMILDEPAAGLHPEEAREFVDQVSRIQVERQLTMLLIEHNMKVVMGLAEYLYVLDFGKLISEGAPDRVRSDPRVIEAYLGVDA